jgi:hypothetical protein
MSLVAEDQSEVSIRTGKKITPAPAVASINAAPAVASINTAPEAASMNAAPAVASFNQPLLVEERESRIEEVVQLLKNFTGVQPVVVGEKENPPISLDSFHVVYILYLRTKMVLLFYCF